MKYNPRVNEAVSRIEGLANGHPYQPAKISQGAMRIMKTLSDCLLEITGMDAITLQPAAGAHGELTGLLMVRAFHESKGMPVRKSHPGFRPRHETRRRPRWSDMPWRT